eukprot:10095692-Alexandrium_andersonii.AAC.1
MKQQRTSSTPKQRPPTNVLLQHQIQVEDKTCQGINVQDTLMSLRNRAQAATALAACSEAG